MNKLARAILMTAALAAALCGCSSPSAAGRSNFADAGLLLDEAESAMASDWRLTARRAGDYHRYRDEQELLMQGVEASGKLGLVPSEGMDRAGGLPIFRADGVMAGKGHVTLTLTGAKDGRPGYLVVKLEIGGPAGRKAAAEWMGHTDKILDGLGAKAVWNVMAQGTLETVFADGAPLADRVMQKLARDLGAKPMDRYEDSGTVSVSFASDRFTSSVRSGASRIAFQAALHRVTDTGAWRLTLGAPLITSEY